MKYGFSTLGCPGWSWSDVFSTAKDLGFSGVEIRGLEQTMYAPEIAEFSPANIDKTKKYLESHNLVIPMLTSGACLAQEAKAKDAFVEACAYVNLANTLGVKYIRVMGTGEPQESEGNFELGAKLYACLCEYAAVYGVTPLIETNGYLSKSENILDFIKDSGENCGILWDLHHTVRYGGESPEYTTRMLFDKIKHVHVKDSLIENGKVKYCMMGYGEIPVKEAISFLDKICYNGFVSLEWVKRWNPDLQEPGIVFAQFADYISKNK